MFDFFFFKCSMFDLRSNIEHLKKKRSNIGHFGQTLCMRRSNIAKIPSMASRYSAQKRTSDRFKKCFHLGGEKNSRIKKNC